MKLWLGLLIGMLLPAMAQQIFELSASPKPDDQVLDEARLFTLHPESREKMSAKLTEFTERTGYEVQVAFFDSLIGTDLPEQTNKLQDAWLGDGPGAVLVVVTDSGDWRIGWATTPEVQIEGGGSVPVLDERDVAPQDRVLVVQTLRNLPRMSAGSIEGAELLVNTFVANLELSFHEPEPKPGQQVRFWVLGIGLLAGVLLIAILTVTWVRRSDEKARDILVFPDVPVGQRLGAPCGGGKVSVMRFSRTREDGDA